MKIKENIPLAPLTTFKIGGPARYFTEESSEQELHEALSWASEHAMPFVILAGGSNVLVPDDGLEALVIKIASCGYSFGGTTLAADAGCNLLALIHATAEKALGGWEKLAGIPGSIGGAIRGNAGAFGTEIRDVLDSAVAFNSKTGEKKEFKNSECDFSYRHSFFKDNPEWIILRARIKLEPRGKVEAARLIEDTIAERERRHLQNVCAAGSFFMNPVAPLDIQEMFAREKSVPARHGRVPAGWLIEKAGMKGAVLGGATASIQHPNYLVNLGGATAEDVVELARRIKTTVRGMFGVELEEEAVVL